MACHLPSFIVAFLEQVLSISHFCHSNYWTLECQISMMGICFDSKSANCQVCPFPLTEHNISHHLSLFLCKSAKVSSEFELVNGLIRFFRPNISVCKNYLPPFAYFICKIANKLVEKVSKYPLLTKWENAVNHAKKQYCCSSNAATFLKTNLSQLFFTGRLNSRMVWEK